MSVRSVLIRLARKVVESVSRQLMQQFNIVQDQALSPMRTMIDQVVGGVWIGDGADAFVEEVSSIMIPHVGRVGDNISNLNKKLGSAVDIVDRADEQVNSAVNALTDTFGGIY